MSQAADPVTEERIVATKIRVYQRGGHWYWHCPACVGGDIGKPVDVRREAFAHAEAHRSGVLNT
jgi:hypothetical protein